MKRLIYSGLCAILVLAGIGILMPVQAAPNQYTCRQASYIYWSPGSGNNANNGSSAGAAVGTIDKARELAQLGGACIRLVQGTSTVDLEDVYARNTGTGVPLATSALYGLLILLAVALVAVGLWARRKAQVQPGYQSQA
jgi:hypothetical protein